ncbi:sugar ABC transporter ATP-binding protein [Salipaludibacillus neizhouensis]|uniref:Sugar ABC transporter ATP-binding protein n=1 Tax=Salipaludibacillus neizhouensis TaxID=885475 RepID=A0A3A9K3M3_9BACI|nr:carbohydrate ABC transporter permease [Salipaludibacillus neizhouensis]RKL66939.1 sugar ABC transporter ATP-binding protein [Salipaludibacillus neizhouensis]
MNQNKPIKSLKELKTLKGKDKYLIIIKYILLISATVIFMIPLAWTISGSLKASGEIFTVPITWIPSVFKWENYVNMFTSFPMVRYAFNSTIIVFFNMVFVTISSFIVAYGFARFRHPLNQTLFFAVLATMMIPEQVTLVPQFLMFSWLGWVNTYLPLIVPSMFGAAFNIFLMRQFIMTIPRELDESAYIDGCNSFQILTKIIAPLCVPIIITVGIFTFNFHWNDFLGPLIYLSDPNKFPLQLGLYSLDGERQGITDYGMLFAASITALIPPLALFAFLQQYIMAGIKLGGSVKG